MITVGIRTRPWPRSGPKWEALDPCRRLVRPKDRSRSAAIFGGQLGGNWQVEWAVFGIQADAHWADIEGHGSCFMQVY